MKRQADERQLMLDDNIERTRRKGERQMKRGREAVASPRLETAAVMNVALKWQIQENHSKPESTLQDSIETLLIGIMKEDQQALSVCTLLERWRSWTERGGMTIEDLDLLVDQRQAFCNAACVIGLLNEVYGKEESTVATDMRDCVQHWKKVRLG